MNEPTGEDAVIRWLDDTAEDWGDVFIHLGEKVLHHPYFIVAVVVVFLYLVWAARGKKR